MLATRLAVLVALIVFASPAAAFSVGGAASACDNTGLIVQIGIANTVDCTTNDALGCDNSGLILQAGVDNEYRCHGTTSCDNNGVIVTAGPGSSYECDGYCQNNGHRVNVGGTYCGSRFQGACSGAVCIGLDASYCATAEGAILADGTRHITTSQLCLATGPTTVPGEL